MKSKGKAMKLAYPRRLFLFLAVCTLHAGSLLLHVFQGPSTLLNHLNHAYTEAMWLETSLVA